MLRAGSRGVSEVWKNTNMRNHMASCVLHEDHLYASEHPDWFDRVVIDKYVDSRDKYLAVLPRIKAEIIKTQKLLAKQFADAVQVHSGTVND